VLWYMKKNGYEESTIKQQARGYEAYKGTAT
jgi:hypothetical protein